MTKESQAGFDSPDQDGPASRQRASAALRNLKHTRAPDLDALVAEWIFGWKWMPLPANHRGSRMEYVLTPDGQRPAWRDAPKLPPSGQVHPAFFTPPWSTDMREAMRLAKHCGLTSVDVRPELQQIAAGICRTVLRPRLREVVSGCKQV